jgi:hypothetical protein
LFFVRCQNYISSFTHIDSYVTLLGCFSPLLHYTIVLIYMHIIVEHSFALKPMPLFISKIYLVVLSYVFTFVCELTLDSYVSC